MTTTGTIDPNLQAPKTNEFIVTFDKQVSADFAVSGSFIYRKYTDFTTTSRPGITAANWTAKTYTPNCSTAPAGALCQPVTYYSPNFQLPVNTVLINQPDYYRLYKGARLRSGNACRRTGRSTAATRTPRRRSSSRHGRPTASSSARTSGPIRR